MKTGWKKLPFDEAIADESGGNIKTPQSEFLDNGEFPVVDQGKELVSGYVNDMSRLCRSILPALVFGDHTRCIKFVDFPFCMGADGIKVLRPKAEAEVKYLFHFLRQLRIHDGGYDRHFKYLKRMDVLLPPLAEQRRIAEVLDRADALRAKRRAALAQLDSLTESIFLDLFGHPVHSSKFGKGTIRPLVETSSGKSAKGVVSKVPTAIPIYGGNGINGWAISPLYEEPVLVFGRVGQQCGTTYITYGPSWVTDNAIVLSILRKDQLDLVYLMYAFSMTGFSRTVKHLDLPFINQEMIVGFPLPIPPMSFQREFARQVAAVEKLKMAQRASLAELDALFASLQHRAFRGEL